MSKNISKIVKSISFSLLIAWIALTPLIWLLKDGLGPNAINSSGLLAVKRTFMTFYWGPIVILLITVNYIANKINNKSNVN